MLTIHSKHDANRVTVVGDVVDGHLKLSAARCGKKDRFVRKVGNLIATGRFNKGKFCRVVPVGSGFTIKNFIEIASDFADEIHSNAKLVCQ